MGRGPPVQDESRLSEQRSRCKAAKVGTPKAYAVVRRRAARPHSPFERWLRPRKLWGEVRKGGVPPSEESLRRRWAFFSSLLIACSPNVCTFLSDFALDTHSRRGEKRADRGPREEEPRGVCAIRRGVPPTENAGTTCYIQADQKPTWAGAHPCRMKVDFLSKGPDARR